ncbi:MAG: YSC84-related protein [Sphingobacteriales bacterium]
MSINGSNLAIDKKANASYYGDSMSARDIFETANNETEAVKLLKESLKDL